MTVITQKNRPVGLVVVDMGSAFLGVPSFYLFHPRPEDVQYVFPSRGTVMQTFDGGFVDDFGEGVADIAAKGHTGWNTTIPGELQFYMLRDLVTLRYHKMRAAKAAAGLPIEDVKMYWVDTLSMFVYEVYPISFMGSKNRQRPLLYQFQIRMTGVKRKLALINLIPGNIDIGGGGSPFDDLWSGAT